MRKDVERSQIILGIDLVCKMLPGALNTLVSLR
jgi:hypothetical protein